MAEQGKTYAVQEEQITQIANAIRGKTGSDEQMTISAMPSLIESIPSGVEDKHLLGIETIVLENEINNLQGIYNLLDPQVTPVGQEYRKFMFVVINNNFDISTINSGLSILFQNGANTWTLNSMCIYSYSIDGKAVSVTNKPASYTTSAVWHANAGDVLTVFKFKLVEF